MKHIKKILPKKNAATQGKDAPKEQPLPKLTCIPKRLM